MIKLVGGQLNQWDVGRSVAVTGDATHVHFANRGDSKALIQEIVDGEAKIPDHLLRTGKALNVYAVLNGVTLESRAFAVRKRERPADYIYEQDQRDYIYKLIDEANKAIENANDAAQELRNLIESGGGVNPGGAVLYTEQKLSIEQQAQAQKNIGVDNFPAISGEYSWSTGITKEERKKVTEVRFVTNYIPTDGAKSWDVSVNAGEITAYLIDDVVTISSNGKSKIRLKGNIGGMFNGMDKLKAVKGLDMLDASLVTGIGGLFTNSQELIEVDLSSWCCDRVANAAGIFEYCTSLKRVKLPYSFKADPKAFALFGGCSSLEYADMGGLNAANVKTSERYPMFAGCTKLREVVLCDVSVMEAAVKNNAPLFADCVNLQKVTFKDGSVIENPSLFEGSTTIKEIVFDGHITSIPDKTFSKCLSLEKVSGLSHVTSVGARAFIFTPKLNDIDLNPAILTSIGESAFRLSSIEDCIDMGTLNAACAVGDFATRAKRWSAEELNYIQNANIPTAFFRVPHADSQKNYDDDKYVFGRVDWTFDDDNGAVDTTIAVGGCQLLALYHEWQCIHRGTDLEMSGFEEFWDTFYVVSDKFPTTKQDFHDDAVDVLGWKCLRKYVDGTKYYGWDALNDTIDRLNSGKPVNATMQSANTSGYHAVLIIGSDAITGKIAVLDSNITNKAELVWVKFEDIFTGAGDYDRLHFHTEKTT